MFIFCFQSFFSIFLPFFSLPPKFQLPKASLLLCQEFFLYSSLVMYRQNFVFKYKHPKNHQGIASFSLVSAHRSATVCVFMFGFRESLQSQCSSQCIVTIIHVEISSSFHISVRWSSWCIKSLFAGKKIISCVQSHLKCFTGLRLGLIFSFS